MFGPLDNLRTLIVAVGVCLAFGAAVALELGWRRGAEFTEPAAPADAPTAGQPQDNQAARFTLMPLSNLAEVTERPLFSPSRRPSAKETAKVGDQPLNASLAGVVISEKSRNIIVTHGDPPVLTRLKEGDELDGWLVGSIEPSRAVFRRNDIERPIKLHDAPGQSSVDTIVSTATAPAPKPERPSRSHR